MPIRITGIPQPQTARMEAMVRAALDRRLDGEELDVVARRLNDGSWLLFIMDGNHVEVLDPALTARILAVLGTAERG
jgi:hypothetical protein